MKRQSITLRSAILFSSLSICLAYAVYRIAWQPIINPTVGDGIAALTGEENTQEAKSVGPNTHNTEEKLGKLLHQDERERFRNIWATHRDVVQTAVVRGRYFLSGMQDIPRSQMDGFLQGLLDVIKTDPICETVERFVRKMCPVRKDLWRDVVLSVDGNKWREQLDNEVRNGPPIRPSRRTHLSLSSFWRIPGEKAVEIPYESLDNGRTRFFKYVSEDFSSSAIVDMTSGLLLESNSHSGDSARRRYQCAFRDFGGIPFPQVTLDITYRDEMLYRFALLIVRDAEFNHPFELNVPN
jgi:hypothetical protein